MNSLVVTEALKAVGRSLRAQRKALGISMSAAAEAAQMSRVTWYRLEKGEASVAWGFLLAAARALDLQVQLISGLAGHAMAPVHSLDKWLPLDIALADFPGLRRLAWQLQEGLESVTPREAWGLYERNWRHLHVDDLPQNERALIAGLTKTFGDMHAGV